MMILNKAYGFTGPNAMVAPQANAMAAVIKPLMMGGETPWLLYGVGAILALLLNWLKVPALPFSLGMFIPLQLNAPLLVGAARTKPLTRPARSAAPCSPAVSSPVVPSWVLSAQP